jgi:secreted Zn-dependent insulinase-like peptidase
MHSFKHVCHKHWIVYLFALVTMAACSFNSADYAFPLFDNAETVVKSENDHRQYRYVELSNKLRVLLISDPHTDKAATSLDIHVGSAQDPKDYQGLAHFLEHMLFLGTSKYPEAGEYQAFINAHSGEHNAYTSFDHTNYFFDIDAAYLDQALDRFSQFFIAPLFTEAYVDREKNAVHSEYMSRIKDDQRKELDVFKAVINPLHPFSKFSVGSLDTLSVKAESTGEDHLKDQLLSFYDKYYSASLMTLVVIGREPLTELESMVTEKFSMVVNNGRQLEKIEQPLFSAGSLPLMLQVKPEKQQRTLSIVFPTEEEMPFYRQKPLNYLGNIIGHEGKGSLLSYLKQQGWAEGLSAGAGISYAGGATFNISIKLTRAGVEKVDEIVDAVFQTVNRVTEAVDQRWLFDEQQALAEQQFRYREMSSPMHYVTDLAAGMHYYPVPDLLRGPFIMRDYDRHLLQRFVSYLNPNNSMVMLNAPEAVVDRQSPFYGAEYSQSPITAERLARWSKVGLNPEITLPDANIFIAADLALKSVDLPASAQNDAPLQLSDQQGLRLWFKQDQRFQLPKGSVFFSVRSPLANDSVEHNVLLEMVVSMVADELNELSYPALLAGLDYSIQPHGRGFSVKINGFSDRQKLLLDKIAMAVRSPQFNAERFENLKREHIRDLENSIKQEPYKRVLAGLAELMYRYHWSDEQRLAIYRAMTLEQLRSFQPQLLQNTEIDMLVYGNYHQEDARSYARVVTDNLLRQHHQPPNVDVVKLSRGVWSRQVDSDYSDAAAMLYLQASDLSIGRRAAMEVTAQSFRADFYTKLRTEKQLGYIVTSGAYPILDVPGLFFLIQSPVAGAAVLKQEIDDYLKQQVAFVETLTEQQFALHRDAVLVRLAESPKNLWEQSERYWKDIAQNYYDFDSRQQLIDALKSLTSSEWKQYFQEDVRAIHQHAIWVYSQGQFSSQANLQIVPIENVADFKSKQGYYSFP